VEGGPACGRQVRSAAGKALPARLSSPGNVFTYAIPPGMFVAPRKRGS
jgi:hypothetical protein